MKKLLIALSLAITSASCYAASEVSLFPLELAYDSGIEHTFTFKKDGNYVLVTAPNEARGYEGGVVKGTYTFEASADRGTILFEDGGKIKFAIPKALPKGETIEVIGMVYDNKGTPRFPDEEMPVFLKKLE